jgi:hypothetical protein
LYLKYRGDLLVGDRDIVIGSHVVVRILRGIGVEQSVRPGAAPYLRCHPFCYAQALGIVDVGSLSVELSGEVRVRNGRPSCRASQGQNHGVRRGYRDSGEVRQSA